MPESSHAHATVVVSRRVVPGRENDFRRWQRQVLRAAQKAPGFLEASIRPPGPDHPDDWVVVYRFASAALLDEWLESPERMAVVDGSRELLLEPPRAQRLVEPSGETVTLVSSVRVRPGAEAQHRALHDAAMATARSVGGLVKAELLPSIGEAQPETVALLTFTDRASLDRWLESDERRNALEAMAEVAYGDRTVNVVGDFAGWFNADGGGAAKRWKQAVVIWFALVPVSLATGVVRQEFFPDLPTAVAVGLGAVVNIIILTWGIMPPLTKALRRWLAS